MTDHHALAPDGGVEAAFRVHLARAVEATKDQATRHYIDKVLEGKDCFVRVSEATTALTSLLAALATQQPSAAHCRLIQRKVDEECGCPEEVWDTPNGELHMHLSAGKPSNACLDNGDEGERHIDLTTATVDEARAAIFGWAGVTAQQPSAAGREEVARIIDPYSEDDGSHGSYMAWQVALAKADAILALARPQRDAEVEALRKHIVLLETALRPFADVCDALEYWAPEVMPDFVYPIEGTVLANARQDCPTAIGKLKDSDFYYAKNLRARATLSPSKGGGE
jgi:hypothetical protein